MFKGADPGNGWEMTDPIFTKVPTLGACMPNIRRVVTQGDFIFSISGKIPGANQYIVGGMKVDEKINALAAFQRFPENRMIQLEDGSLRGNIIVDNKGRHLPFDYHSNHEKRVENYIVGCEPIFLELPEQIQRAREETIPILNQIFGTDEELLSKIVSRWRKLDKSQIADLLSWMKDIKQAK